MKSRLIILLLVACALVTLGDTTASWYGESHRGKPMANGKPFDPDAFTAASWFFPLGSEVRVTYGTNAVDVIITDRGPAKRLLREGRIIDLSHAAFKLLENPDVGIIPVTVAMVSSNRFGPNQPEKCSEKESGKP